MFACDYYPADEAFLDSVRKEVTHQVFLFYKIRGYLRHEFAMPLCNMQDNLFSDSATAVPSFNLSLEWK